jgi:DNA-binding NtrC family response regulator
MKRTKPVRQDPASPRQVFVVDDNSTLVEFATAVLESAGHKVRPFCDPKEVLNALNEAGPKPALLVTDYDMGEINGLDLIVSSHKIHPALKTVLLSGTVGKSTVLKHPARVNRFLSKPYRGAQLKRLVAELLRA